MEDSFFGFDTLLPLEEDGRIAEPSEEEYDALNDETFGSAINGDWEEAHESMVRLTGNRNVRRFAGGVGAGDLLDFSGSGRSNNNGDKHLASSAASSGGSTPAHMMNARLRRANLIADSDLELNLSGMKLDDVDISFNDTDSMAGIGGMGGIHMDPSVWASHPVNATGNSRSSLFGNAQQNSGGNAGNGMNANPADFLRQHFSSPFQQHQQHQQQQHMKHDNGSNNFGLVSQLPQQGAPKICTLEDIERNIINQQQQQQHHMQQQQQTRQQQEQHHQQQQQLLNDILKLPSKTPTPIQQQQHQQQQQQQQQHLQKQPTPMKGPPGFGNTTSPPRPSNNFANNLAQHPLGNMLQQSSNVAATRLPPGYPLYPPGLGPGPGGHQHGQGGPPQQLPPHPLLNHPHGLPPNFPHPHQRPLPNPHLPIALNNFAMHPNFNAMRAAAAAAGIHPAALVPGQGPLPPQQGGPRMPPNPAALLNHHQQQQQQYNMFNMRLVQEIQQNHPLLQQNAARQMQQQQQNGNMHHYQQLQQQRGGAIGVAGLKQNHHRRDGAGGSSGGGNGISANGNLPHEEYDEYANLMSTRDKHWLIGIQLSQLNTDTPYIDDFYYTVYRERKAVLSGNLRHSQAHKDNQLNHPLTQPKGHAQLILVQLGNKNGTRNGHQHRERHNSEAGGSGQGNNNGGGQDQNHQHHQHQQQQQQKTPYVFTPLKFENSLGKLQYGSVTAPRKIIDADIMSGEATANDSAELNTNTQTGAASTRKSSKDLTSTASNNLQFVGGAGGGDMASTAQRKSRHILLHIETLYRNVLKLEDLDNPNAIATIIMKKKKESERIAALEQLEYANKTPEERAADIINPTPSMNPALKNKFAYEIETKDALITKLIGGLTNDKVVAMMNVRKGKALLRRIMPYIENHDIRWNVWIGVFSSLQIVVKKDREDAEGMLYALYPEFKKQIKLADFADIVRISSSITLNDKKSNGVFCSKFGISSLVCLILQAEQIYVSSSDVTLNDVHKENWRQFLDEVATSLNRTIQNQTICAAIESDSIQPMMNHFARFKDLKLDSLLALVTEAKQQIN